MKTYYTKNHNGQINQTAAFKFADDALETDREIVRGYDGGLYFAGEEPDDTQYAHKMEIQAQIAALQDKLRQYDYIGIKIATGRATADDYADEIADMTVWAAEINELETTLKGMPE